MPENNDTLAIIGTEVGKVFEPLKERLTGNQPLLLFSELGLQLPAPTLADGSLQAALNATGQAAGQLPGLIGDLASAAAAEDVSRILQKSLEIINQVKTLIPSFDVIGTRLGPAATGAGIPAADVNAFVANFGGKLFDYLIVRYLENYHEFLLSSLEFAGIVERLPEQANSTDPNKPPFLKRTLRFDRIGGFFQDPAQVFQEVYNWNDNAFVGDRMMRALHAILTAFAIPVVLEPPAFGESAYALRFSIFRLKPNLDLNPKGLSLLMFDEVPAGFTFTFPFFLDGFQVKIELETAIRTNAGITFQPPAQITVASPSVQVQGKAFVFLIGRKSEPFILLGQAAGSRMQMDEVGFGAGATLLWNVTANQADASFGFEIYLKGGKIVINTGGADGFLANILSGLNMEADFDLKLGFNSASGFYIVGSGALEFQLPLHIELGPIQLDGLTLSVGLDGGKFPISAGVNIKGDLGPLQIAVENMGVTANFSFPGGTGGNLGPVNFDLGFKPPNGVGLSINAGVVTGGGYLFFDFDREEYAGVLQLDISGIVSITAIGLITTKMPDGSKGFSLLVIMTVEFTPGIQLGFGFTFLGIGGLLGLNRTVKLEVLAQGIRSGTLNNIMFPEGDIIANAPRIISDLRAIFPPEEGKFLIGPMVKLGWGTPTLISVAVGVIIEIPGNFAIVGVFKVALPTADAALIIIQVAFIGAVEFDKKRLWFFASMFDSRVLFITLEGEMGLLIGWGDDANFVVSVGGFHPRFTPPPLPFPSPRRLAIDLSNNPAYKVRVECYFAVTSNTVQFGARAELQFGLDDFGIQGHIGFDVLFQFSPFFFMMDISASVSLRVFGFDVFTIRLEFSLEGPTPYRARGSGYLSILFFEISADFDVTWGESADTTLPPIAVMPLLKTEFEKIENWKAELPAANNLLVSLRALDEAVDKLVLHPVGVLRISQRLVPLDLTLDKLGTQKPSDAKKFSVAVNTTNLGVKGKVNEQFAMAQFQNMSDADKLSRPAFQPNPGGVDVSVTGNQLKTSRVVKRIVRYELITIDTNYKRAIKRFFVFTNALFYHFFKGSAVTQNVFSQSYAQQKKPRAEAVAVLPETYVVAFTANNAAFSSEAIFGSEAQAVEFLRGQDAGLSEHLHVIPQVEAVGF